MPWEPVSYEEGRPSFTGSESTRYVFLKPGQKERFLVLSPTQFAFWSHEYWAKVGKRKQKLVHPCLIQNKIDSTCPFCGFEDDRVSNSSYAGHLTVIRLTPTKTDNGAIYCFERQIMRAKAGSKKKPGMYHVIEAIRKDVGGLRGVTLECTRNGEISEVCGDSIIFPRNCEKISDPKEFLTPRIQKYLDYVNNRVGRDRLRTMEDHLKWHPIEDIDFSEFFTPQSRADIERRLGIQRTPMRDDVPREGRDNGRGNGRDVPPPSDEDFIGEVKNVGGAVDPGVDPFDDAGSNTDGSTGTFGEDDIPF